MVIDSNVIRVADALADQADAACVAACVQQIDEARASRVHLDAGGEILTEYLRRQTARPYSVGTLFIHHLLRNQANPHRCSLISITPDEERGYVEFPNDERLNTFDPADRKFVAVSIAAEDDPCIVNAVDSDWAPVTTALLDHGVEVVQLCSHLDPLLSPGA